MTAPFTRYIRKTLALFTAFALLGTQPVSALRSAAGTPGNSIVFYGLTDLPFPDGEPLKGVDVSSVISLENSGVRFYDRSGNEQDIFLTLRDAGVNTVRVRIWNDPYASDTRKNYGGGICDIENAEKIARRCAKAGLKLLVDFHYSDFWADPGKQKAPKAWANYTVAQKADAVYSFTAETLERLAKTNAEIAMVQVGNETTTGMCGVMLADYNWSDEGWQALASLFNAGAKAVRTYNSRYDCNALVALHFTNPEKAENMNYLAKMLCQNNVDYDVFATSYYPYWHGTLANLTQVLTGIAQTYHKQVMVAETSRVRTFYDRDGYPNTIGDTAGLGQYESYEVSPEGQCAFLRDVFRAVAAVPDGMGIGVCYWEPAWLGVGTDAASNKEKWETYGSGWATEAAGEYDDSAKKWAGGSSVENESLFDDSGIPLDSLYVFREVTGEAASSGCLYGKDLLENPGFEADGGWSDRPLGWTLTPAENVAHFDVRAEDARSGSYALHWYSEQNFGHCFAGTTVTVPEDGTYLFSCYVQGDEKSSYAVDIVQNGRTSANDSGHCKGWNVWLDPVVCVQASAGETLRIMLTVNGAAGSYGSVDDCKFCKFTEEVLPPPGFDGDVNMDGFVNQLDVQCLTAYLLGREVSLLEEEADRNGDGVLDARDLSLLKNRVCFANQE